MNIFFDLDGTLVDSRIRLYLLFKDLVEESKLSYDEYWEMKRRRVSNENILKSLYSFADNEIELFKAKWMGLIETEEYLQHDFLYDGVSAMLESLLGGGADLYVCTARQYETVVYRQLESFNLSPFFKNVMVTCQRESKENLIRTIVPSYELGGWFVGDTGHDIEVGKKLNLKTCAVGSGFLSLTVLAEYGPDRLLNSVSDFSV